MNASNIRRLLTQEIHSLLFTTNVAGYREEVVNPHITDTAILCGSFNPLHEGHIELLDHGQFKSGKLHKLFELSVVNCDKGALEEKDIMKRVVQFERDGLNLLLTTQPYFY